MTDPIIIVPGRKSSRSRFDITNRRISMCSHSCVDISDTERKKCRNPSCDKFIPNSCYLQSHSCESCVCRCRICSAGSTTTTSTSANKVEAESNIEVTEQAAEIVEQTSTTTVAAKRSLPAYTRRVSFVKLSAKKACEYKSGCPYLATYNCHLCSTFHCDWHVNRHFYELHKMDLLKHEIVWTLYAPMFGNLGIPCNNASERQCDKFAFMRCIVCEVAFCSNHSNGHDCNGTYNSHQHPIKFQEFLCQHCNITFIEYRESDRYADFTGELESFERPSNKGKKQKIAPICIPCEERVDEEFSKSLEYVPVSLPSLHDDSDEDKATNAHNRDHQGTDRAVIDPNDEGSDDSSCNGKEGSTVNDIHSQDNCIADNGSSDHDLAAIDLTADETPDHVIETKDEAEVEVEVPTEPFRHEVFSHDHSQVGESRKKSALDPIRRALSHCIHGSDAKGILHSCQDCSTYRINGRYPNSDKQPVFPESIHITDQEHHDKLQQIFSLLQLPTVKVSEDDIDGMSSHIKRDSEATEDLDEGNVPLICSKDRPNPTKVFNGLPFFDGEIIYDCTNVNNQEIDLLKPYEYCYKCYVNTGCQYLLECVLCGQLSFIGCAAKVDDSQFGVLDGLLRIVCCYCICLKRDSMSSVNPKDVEYYHLVENIVRWESCKAASDSFLMEQYERRMELDQTENEYTHRLYGNYNDPSEELAQSISVICLQGMQSNEYVCPQCQNAHIDVIHDGDFCVECCLKNLYNHFDIEMNYDKRVIFNKQMYNWGSYPASENFIQLPFYPPDWTDTPNISKDDLINLKFINNSPNFIYDNSYRSPMNNSIIIDVVIQQTVTLGRKIAMLFSRSKGIADYKLQLVSIEQYVHMVKCRVLELSEETFCCEAYNKRNLDLYANEIKEVTAVNNISSMYERWTYDGRFTGLNPFLRPLECKNIRGSPFMAQAFSNLGTVHLLWEKLPSLGDEQYGLEEMNGDAFYAMINSGLITRINPSSKPDMEEHCTRTNCDGSISSPLILSPSPQSSSLPSLKHTLSDKFDRNIDEELNNSTTEMESNENSNKNDDELNNNTYKSNENSNKNDDELNIDTAPNKFIDRTDGRINTPVVDDMNNTIQQPLLEKMEIIHNLESVQVCLNDEISVTTSFHTVGQVQFSLMIYFKKLKIFYRIGDFHPGRGFFACCGYLENDIANLNLFFIDKDFKEPVRLTYKYYMKIKFVPNQQVNQKEGKKILCPPLFANMEEFANNTISTSQTRRNIVHESYEEKRKSLRRPSEKVIITNEKKGKTPLTRNKTATSSTITCSSETIKSKQPIRGRKRKQDDNEENENDCIERLISNGSDVFSDHEALKCQGQRGKVVSLSSKYTEQQNGSDELTNLKDQLKVMLEVLARKERDDLLAQKKKDEDLREKLHQDVLEQQRKNGEIERAKWMKQLEDSAKERVKQDEEKRLLEEELFKRNEEAKARAEKELADAQRKRDKDEKELAEKKFAAELLEVREANRLLMEELFKRNEEAKARAEKEVADAQRKRDEEERKAFDDAVSKEVAATNVRLRRAMEEENVRKDNELLQILKEKLNEESKKNQDLTAQRLKEAEEELRDKRSNEKLAERNELLRQHIALEAMASRAAEQADLALQQKRQLLAVENLKLKKEEFEVEERQRFERERQMKAVQLALAEKEVILAERNAMIEENRKAADHQRKKDNQKM